MNPKLVVLGGSTPFTVSFIDAIKAVCHSLPAFELVLHGRNEINLDLVARYAGSQLSNQGWSVSTELHMEEALSGAMIVVHQIRYGAMEGRLADEEFCARHQVVADETLGPAALLCGMRMLRDVQSTSRMLADICPEAWVLNLTNPLSSVMAIIAEAGIDRCIGLCELPWVTVQEAAQVFGLPACKVEWCYSGLNHRGFIYEFWHQDQDLLTALPQRLGDNTIGGISADQIADLGAIPLKYFQLVTQHPPTSVRRATYLINLREQILEELRASNTTSPPSLRRRYLEWYPQSVVPMIAALSSATPTTQLVNRMGDDGIAWEGKAQVNRSGIHRIDQPGCNGRVEKWLEIFQQHEHAFLNAMKEPAPQNILETLVADPTVPVNQVESLGCALWQEYQTRHSSPKCHG